MLCQHLFIQIFGDSKSFQEDEEGIETIIFIKQILNVKYQPLDLFLPHVTDLYNEKE
jgi:hypothetical protein